MVGFLDNGSSLNNDFCEGYLGQISQLEHFVNALGIDEIVVAIPANRREQTMRIISRGFHRRVKVKFLPDTSEFVPNELAIERLGHRPYLGFSPMAKVTWIKRASDLILGSVALIALSPLLAALAVAIKLDSAGPVFYRQVRIGKHGGEFQIFKFRSMGLDADQLLEDLKSLNEATGPLFKIRDDPRVTRVGRFLRRFSLDELPQLFNVIRGEMSLVGPRPPVPSEVAQYEDWQLGRLRAKPGMTGLWQVSGRSEMPFYDMFAWSSYIRILIQ